MRLPRMTTRRWMIAVAVFGLAMGGIAYALRLERLRVYYHFRAVNLRMAEQSCRSPSYRDEVQDLAAAERLRRLAEKYEYAARHPWLSIAPDPPAPEP
jgi:hypothetical protein